MTPSTAPAGKSLIALAGVLFVAIVGFGAAAYMSGLRSAPEAPKSGGGPPGTEEEESPHPKVAAGAHSIPQAPWKLDIFPVGGGPETSEKQRKRLRAQKPRLRDLVRTTYNDVFLEPASRSKAVRSLFSARSAGTWLASSAGLKPTVEDVRTVRRRASIGILVGHANRAAAKVVVGAKGDHGNRRFHVLHRSTLWLERAGKTWTVIGFDIDQRPVT